MDYRSRALEDSFVYIAHRRRGTSLRGSGDSMPCAVHDGYADAHCWKENLTAIDRTCFFVVPRTVLPLLLSSVHLLKAAASMDRRQAGNQYSITWRAVTASPSVLSRTKPSSYPTLNHIRASSTLVHLLSSSSHCRSHSSSENTNRTPSFQSRRFDAVPRLWRYDSHLGSDRNNPRAIRIC